MAIGPRAEELCAGALLRARFGGTVRHTDFPGGPTGTHDLELRTESGSTLAVEVTQETPEKARRQAAAISSHSWETDEIDGLWYVAVDGDAEIRRLMSRVVGLIRQGAATRHQPLTRRQTLFPDKVQQELSQAGIEFLVCVGEQSPGQIIVAPTPPTKAFAASDLVELVEDHAGRDDNRSKLSGATADERHLWIWVTVEAMESFVSAAYGAAPTKSPVVPECIDSVWIVPYAATSSGQLTSWNWSKQTGWEQLDNWPIPEGQDLSR